MSSSLRLRTIYTLQFSSFMEPRTPKSQITRRIGTKLIDRYDSTLSLTVHRAQRSTLSLHQRHFPGACSDHQKLWQSLARMPPPWAVAGPMPCLRFAPFSHISLSRSDHQMLRRGRTSRLSDALWESWFMYSWLKFFHDMS